MTSSKVGTFLSEMDSRVKARLAKIFEDDYAKGFAAGAEKLLAIDSIGSALVAGYSAAHEHGTSKVPPRPFLGTALASARPGAYLSVAFDPPRGYRFFANGEPWFPCCVDTLVRRMPDAKVARLAVAGSDPHGLGVSFSTDEQPTPLIWWYSKPSLRSQVEAALAAARCSPLEE